MNTIEFMKTLLLLLPFYAFVCTIYLTTKFIDNFFVFAAIFIFYGAFCSYCMYLLFLTL